MHGQRKTLIPSRLNYIPVLSYQTNNNKPRSTIGFNSSIHNNTTDNL